MRNRRLHTDAHQAAGPIQWDPLLAQERAIDAIAAPAVLAPRARAADKSLTVTSWGGDYNKSVREVFADPFTKETGIPVTLDRSLCEGRINAGDLVALGGFSHAGDYSAAALIRWNAKKAR